MESVGVRELKAQLSRHLKRVRAGSTLVVTEHGRAVATITRIEPPGESAELRWARAVVASGEGQWSGGKPRGSDRSVRPGSGQSLSDAVIEDRR